MLPSRSPSPDCASAASGSADTAAGPPAPPQLPGRIAGYQSWRNLLFLHWRVPPEKVQPLLPAPLEVETFDGDAWVGLVLFTMRGVRPRWFPAVPFVSRFHETNVRTYVRHPGCESGSDTGVWFFSLDAACSPAVVVARWKWGLPYFRSRMSLEQDGNRVEYNSTRLWPGPAGASASASAVAGELLPEPRIAGSLDSFLVDRYRLFAGGGSDRRGGHQAVMRTALVEHVPYPLRQVQPGECRQSLTAAAGIDVHGQPDHVAFSDGVDVRVGPLEQVL